MRNFVVSMVVVFLALGCEMKLDTPTHRATEAEAYCSTEQILNFGLSGSKSLLTRCDKGIGINENCRRAHYKRCLRSYR